MATVKELIELAKAQVGNGPSKYRNWYYGYNASGVAWCAVWVSWLFSNAGVKMYKTDGAGCFARNGQYGKWYESEYSDSSTTPKAGDIITFVWNHAGRYYNQDVYYSDHVGIVYYVDDDFVYTIEGNSGSDNDTSSVKMKYYSRKSGCINGYFRPNTYIDTNNVTDESEEKEMNFKKGDKSDGVLAYKRMIIQANKLGIIKSTCNTSNSFGDGTHKATLEIQKKCGLEQDGIAGSKTISALGDLINVAMDNHIKQLEIGDGDWGIGVRFLKIALRTLQNKGVITTKPDEKFGYGNGTKQALMEIQKLSKIDVDGIAGKDTANAIEKKLLEM